MSLYNLIHGVNPMAGLLLGALGVTPKQVPRFRDCYWTGTHIAIYTRTGGGNRYYYESEDACRRNYPEYFGEGKEEPSGPWNADLRAMTGFDYDEDDDYDSTYATFYFTPSPRFTEALKAVPAADASPEQKWESFFERLKGGSDDPQVARVLKAVEPMMQQIAAGLTGDGEGR